MGLRLKNGFTFSKMFPIYKKPDHIYEKKR